jgi:ATP-dependent Zn protease
MAEQSSGATSATTTGSTTRARGLDAAVAARRAKVVGTRKPMAFWDRVKILLLLGVIFAFMVGKKTGDNPLMSTGDAIDIVAREKRWLLWLMLIEVVRQLHFVVSEHWAAYHEFWANRVFGGLDRRSARINDWNRYRMGRVLRIGLLLAILSLLASEIWDTSFFQGLPEALQRFWGNLPFILQMMFYLLFGVMQFVAIFYFMSKGGVDTYFPEDINTRFSDVWGQDHVVERIKENVVFIEDPESIEEKGGYVPGGILLWGPPGTGKTLIAEAVAGETNKPFVFVDPGAFINMFMGVGILKVKALFRKLRKLALRYGGVIVFFDEADSLGNRGMVQPGAFGHAHGHVPGLGGPAPWAARPSCNGFTYLSDPAASLVFQSGLTAGAEESTGERRKGIFVGGMGGGGMGTLQALLTEISGLKKPRGFLNRFVRRVLGMRPKPPPKYRILVMMATNMPDALDAALLRPGRLDRIYRVGYPAKEGRVRTYKGYFDKINHDLTDEQVEKLAVMTPYATGALIKDMVNEALIIAIGDGRDTVTWSDVMRAKQLKRLGPPENVDYIERERHAIAIHEACHALAFYRLAGDVTIDMATIEKGMSYLGMVSSVKIDEHFTQWKRDYEADIMVSLASLAGEKHFFEGDNSSGVSGDLETATVLATLMEGYWGMGSALASQGANRVLSLMSGGSGVPGLGGGGGGHAQQSDFLRGSLGQRVEADLRQLFDRTRRLIAENRYEILAIAHALETHKTLNGEDVVAVIEGRRGPLVDGRPYATEEFRRAADAYHELAVLAHQRHTGTELVLPELPAPEPELVAAAVPGSEWAPAADAGYDWPPLPEPSVYRPLPYGPPVDPPGRHGNGGHQGDRSPNGGPPAGGGGAPGPGPATGSNGGPHGQGTNGGGPTEPPYEAPE